MPEINDFLVGGNAVGGPQEGLPVCEPVRGHEVVDEVWEEKNDREVNIIPCTSISFAQGETLELVPGQTKKLEIVQDPFLSNVPYLTFESSDLKVVRIIDDCVALGCCEGEATIMASSSDGSGLVASITITVAPKKAEEPEEPGEEGKGEFIEPTLPEHIYAGEEVEVSVGFKSDTEITGVKFIFSTSGPGNATYKMTDSLGTEFTFQNNGEWGPSEGFTISSGYEVYSPVKATFDAEGEYTFTVQLVKVKTGETVNEITSSITVEAPGTRMAKGKKK